MADILYIVVPCYNEEEVLPETSRRLRAKLEGLMAAGKISERAGCCLSMTAPGTGRGSSSPGCMASAPCLRGGSLPQPGAPECVAGGADDRKGAV